MGNAERATSAEAILDGAEQVFAQMGYHGASMRQIAEHASITQALLHYHFHTKENLYEAVFKRRSFLINRQREESLARLFADGHVPTLEDVLGAYYSPVMTGHGSNNAAFAQMVTAIAVGTDELSQTLMTKYYDPIAHTYIGALAKVVPGLQLDEAVWAYLMCLGARAHVSAATSRASRLSEGRCDTRDTERALTLLIKYAAAGIRALALEGKSRAKAPARARKQAESGRPRGRDSAVTKVTNGRR